MGTAREGGAFARWVLHRAAVVRLGGETALAEAAGVAPEAVARLLSAGSLRGVGRSARGALARALKVSLRDLEAIAAGRRGWIGDGEVLDLTRLTPGWVAGRAAGAGCGLVASPARAGRGVPVVGRVLGGGVVEWWDDVCPETVERLAVRYAGAPDAYALRVSCADLAASGRESVLLFQPVALVDLVPGDAVVLTFADGTAAGQSVLGRLEPGEGTAQEVRVVALDSSGGGAVARVVPRAALLRAGRLIDATRTGTTPAP